MRLLIWRFRGRIILDNMPSRYCQEGLQWIILKDLKINLSERRGMKKKRNGIFQFKQGRQTIHKENEKP